MSRAAGPKTPKRQNEKRHSREPMKGGNFGGGGAGNARKEGLAVLERGSELKSEF